MKKLLLLLSLLFLLLPLSPARAATNDILVFKLDGTTPQDDLSILPPGGLTLGFQVKLSAAPTSTVKVQVKTSSGAPLTITSGSTLTFTSSNTLQKVSMKEGTVTNAQNGQKGTITFSASGYTTKTVNYTIGSVTTTTSGTVFGGKNLTQLLADPTGFVYISWRVVRVIINVVLLLALLLISFSNILRINIDTYTVKKALPNLVIGVILANASFLIVKYMADIATVATYLFVGLQAGSAHPSGFTDFSTFFAAVLSTLGINSAGTFILVLGPISPLLVLVFLIIALILILWLAFIFYFRLVAIYLLTILAPLAFVSYGIPGFEKYFKQWWQQFVKWLFILPAMSAIFWLMLVIGGASANNQSVASLLIMYALLITALSLPSKMGGAIVDKASKLFAKNPLSKGVTDYASLKGQQIGYRLPGVAKYQAWREISQANTKKDIEQLKKRGANKILAGEGIIGTRIKGKNVSIWGRSTGKNQAKLELLDKEISANEAEAKALQEVLAAEEFNLPERINLAEFKKKLAEERKGTHENEKKLDFLLDKKNEDLIKKVNTAIIDNEVLTKEVGRAEGMAKGNQATEYLQPLQAVANWKRLRDEYDHLSPEQQAGRQGQELASKIQTIESAYAKMQTDPAYAKEYGSLTISQLNDVINDKNSKHGRLLAGRQRQTAKMFNEGIAGQIETDAKEQTVPELEREMRAYLDKELGNDQAKIQAFFDGDTASLYAAGVSTGDIRSGIAIAEKYKTILRSTNDVRHGDALQSFANLHNTHTAPASAIAVDPNINTANQKERREAAAKFIQNSGILARQANNRNQNAVPTPSSPPPPPPAQPNQPQPTFSQEDLDYAAENLGGGFGQAPTIQSGNEPPETENPAPAPPEEDEEENGDEE